MSIPKEPRQQMINMMYLVLTALLALNISAEILNAFYLVNEGMNDTKRAMQQKNTDTYAAFQRQLQMNQAKTQPLFDKAEEVRKLSNKFVQYVETLKDRLVHELEGDTVKDYLEEGTAKNLDVASTIMLVEKKGDELQKEINNTRAKMLGIVSAHKPKAKESFEKSLALKAENPPADPEHGSRTWAEKNFEMVPAIAAVVVLNKIQSDMKTAEADIINWLFTEIGGEDFKVDRLIARVIAPTSYVTLGQQYKSDIFVSASSSGVKPEVFIGELDMSKVQKDSSDYYLPTKENPLRPGFQPVEVVGGMGKFVTNPGREGEIKYSGAIKILNTSTGETSFFPFESSYIAAKPAVIVSPEKMNVFYIGVDNPVAVSVPGFPAEKIGVGIGDGSITAVARGQGKYVVRVSKPGKTNVNVTVTMPDGNRKGLPGVEFRVKRVPDPQGQAGSLKPGKVATNVFQAQRGLIAHLEGFDFDVKFEVLSYEMLYIPKRQDPVITRGTGAAFDAKMKAFLDRAKPGDKIFFDEIKVRAPDGTSRKLSSIAYDLL